LSSFTTKDADSTPVREEDGAWPSLPGSSRSVLVAGLLFVVALSFTIASNAVWVAAGRDLEDFRVYVDAGRAVWEGRALYEPGAASLPTVGGTFKYTPFAAVLFAALAGIPLAVSRALVFAVDVGALLAVVWVCWGMLGYRRSPGRSAATLGVAALCLGLQPVLWNMIWGQINFCLLALVLLDLARRDNRWSKGIGVGIAAGIKLIPGIFILYLLLTRRFRAAAVSVAAFLLTIGVGFLVLPHGSRMFWAGNVAEADRVSGAGAADMPENQSVRGVLARLTHNPDIPTVQWLPVAALLAVVAMVAAVLASRRGEELLAVSLAGVASLFVSPLAWSHYWLWLVPFLVIGVHSGLKSRWAWPVLALGYAAVFAWPVEHRGSPPYSGLIFLEADHPTALLAVLRGINVEVGLVLMVVSLVHLARRRTDDGVRHELP
jgi:alpha-1,2-mannosyltransferase